MAGVTTTITVPAPANSHPTAPRRRHPHPHLHPHQASHLHHASHDLPLTASTPSSPSSRLHLPAPPRPLLPLLLLPLLLLPPPGAAAASPPACPPWLADYVAFHRAQRGAPDARYLLHTCRGNICGGVGDRLRGVLWSARLAIATRRVLLVTWSRPMELTHFLRPRDIDWTLEGLPPGSLGSGSQVRVHWLDGEPPAALLAGQDGEYAGFGVLELEHNTLEHVDAGPGAPEVALWSPEAACLYQALFQPTELVTSKLARELEQVLGPGNEPYGAVHLRIGGLVGEQEASIGLHRMSRLTYFIQSVSCLRTITNAPRQQQQGLRQGQGLGQLQDPVAGLGLDGVHERSLVVSDSNHLRQKIQSGILPGLLAPSFTATHFDRVSDPDPQLHADTFVALGLLAHADCAVYTDSGFSRFAYYWGYQRCVAMLPRYQDSRAPPHFHLCDMSDIPAH